MLRSKFTIDERIELNRMLNRFLLVMLILCLSGVGLTLKLASDLRNIPVHAPEIDLTKTKPAMTSLRIQALSKKEKPEGANLQTLRLEKF